jgi:hypothetical protein
LAQVQMLLEEGVAPRDIGVIAPYNAQVAVLLVFQSFFTSSRVFVALGPAPAVAVRLQMHRACAIIGFLPHLNRNFFG